MSYNKAVAAGCKLSSLGDDQLAVGEKKYGSGDDYVTNHSLLEIVQYSRTRIDTYLELVEKGKGNAETLLGDCENHLRFILAKILEDR